MLVFDKRVEHLDSTNGEDTENDNEICEIDKNELPEEMENEMFPAWDITEKWINKRVRQSIYNISWKILT